MSSSANYDHPVPHANDTTVDTNNIQTVFTW